MGTLRHGVLSARWNQWSLLVRRELWKETSGTDVISSGECRSGAKVDGKGRQGPLSSRDKKIRTDQSSLTSSKQHGLSDRGTGEHPMVSDHKDIAEDDGEVQS